MIMYPTYSILVYFIICLNYEVIARPSTNPSNLPNNNNADLEKYYDTEDETKKNEFVYFPDSEEKDYYQQISPYLYNNKMAQLLKNGAMKVYHPRYYDFKGIDYPTKDWDTMGLNILSDKRNANSYMSMCHFKICNMGRRKKF